MIYLQMKHDSYDRMYRHPFGAVVSGQQLTIRLTLTGLTDKAPQDVSDHMDGRDTDIHVSTSTRTSYDVWNEGEWQDVSGQPSEMMLWQPYLWLIFESAAYVKEGRHERYAKLLPMHIETNPNAFDPNAVSSYIRHVRVPAAPGLLWYAFVLKTEEKAFFYGPTATGRGGQGRMYETELPLVWGDGSSSEAVLQSLTLDNGPCHLPPMYQVTVYETRPVPAWYREAVVYQIFVDRFHRGVPVAETVEATEEHGMQETDKALFTQNHITSLYPPGALFHAHWEDIPLYVRDETGRVVRWTFFGGNLYGVLEKLDALRELGIRVIYLNPIFESSSNHKYDVADYKSIDPAFGDDHLWRLLVERAKEKGIRFILDGVFSHTGADSRYFNRYGRYETLGAYQSKDSPYYPWYRFQQWPDVYESWWGVETMPNVNECEASYLDYMVMAEDSVLRHWQKTGIGGWRLDVVDELPPCFLETFVQTLKMIDAEAVVIGEVWEDASNKVSYDERRFYFCGRQLDATMNYPLREAMLKFVSGEEDARAVWDRLMRLYEHLPPQNFFAQLNLLGTHDTPRIRTVLETWDPLLAEARWRLLYTWLFLYPGVPHVYYGDEVGLVGGKDPDNRRTYPWGREDMSRYAFIRALIQLRHQLKLYEADDFYQKVLSQAESDGLVFGYRWVDQHAPELMVGRYIAVVLYRRAEVALTFDVSEVLPAAIDLTHLHVREVNMLFDSHAHDDRDDKPFIDNKVQDEHEKAPPAKLTVSPLSALVIELIVSS